MKKEIKLGLAGITALVLLFFGIKFLKGSNLLNNTNTYYIIFKHAKGLSRSATVFADGYNIGIVGDIVYNKPSEIVVSIEVNRDIKIPYGTTAQLDEAVLGGCTLNMVMGPNPANCYAPGDTLRGSNANGIMATAGDLVPQAKAMLSRIDTLVMTLNLIAGNPALPQILENTRSVTQHLDHSSQRLDQIMEKDIPIITGSLKSSSIRFDTITANLAQLKLQQTIEELNKAITNLNNATQKLNSTDNSIGLLLNDTLLYSNLNNSTKRIGDLLEDIKQHPGRYVNISVFGRKNKASTKVQ